MKVILLMVVGLSLSVASFAKDPASSPQSIAKGKTLFTSKVCFTCHGQDGKGNPAMAALQPRNLVSDKFVGGEKPKEIFNTLTKGLPPKMPPVMATEEEKWAIVHYILSLRKGHKK